MSLEKLAGRVCLLTGATGGIGRALARVLTESGVKLLLSGRDEAALEALEENLPTDSVVDRLPGDLTDGAVRQMLAGRAAAQAADTLVNLCGRNDVSLLETQQPEAISAMLAANLHAPMDLTRLLLPALGQRQRPLVVNVGSVFGQIGYPGHAAYCATKFGLRGFSEALRRELQDSSVRVVHVEPRATRTRMNEGVGERLNAALGSRVDSPLVVAVEIARAMARSRAATIIGMPERLYSRINAVLPSIVDRSLAGHLSTLKEVLRTTPINP